MESERELKAPYVLVACAQPHSEYAPEAELAHLRARGFVASDISGILGENFLRVFGAIWGG